jgi:hypothetical protein
MFHGVPFIVLDSPIKDALESYCCNFCRLDPDCGVSMEISVEKCPCCVSAYELIQDIPTQTWFKGKMQEQTKQLGIFPSTNPLKSTG